jgi:hypothetical protein
VVTETRQQQVVVTPLPFKTPGNRYQMISVRDHCDGGMAVITLARRPQSSSSSIHHHHRLRTLHYRCGATERIGSTLLERLCSPVEAVVTPADLGLDHLVVERGGARYLLREGDDATAYWSPHPQQPEEGGRMLLLLTANDDRL